MNNMRCSSCVYFDTIAKTVGICYYLGGMIEKNILKDSLFLDRTSVLEKIQQPTQKLYNPILVENTFGCVGHKQEIPKDG